VATALTVNFPAFAAGGPIRRCVCVVGPGIVPGRYVGTLYEGKTGIRPFFAPAWAVFSPAQ